MAVHDELPRLGSSEAAIRSEAMRAIVQAGPKHYDPLVVQTLVRALDHNDYEMQEWATVALRQCRDEQTVSEALWACYRTETRHSVRSCALIALGHLGQSLTPDDLRSLYAERREHPKDLILESAIRWAGHNDGRPEMLVALRDIQIREATGGRREPRLQATIATALLRSARGALASGAVKKPWLKEHGFIDVLEKLRETRMERLLAEELARQAQPALPDLEVAREEEPLVPGYPLADATDRQHIQDLAEIRNVHIREQRSFVRDQRLAQDAKRKAGFRCQHCNDTLSDSRQARRFVQAHHLEPLSEGGADVAENVAVLCPNCHAKIHAGAVRAERTDEGFQFVEVELIGAVGGGRDVKTPDAVCDDRQLRDQIVELFRQLERESQGAVLRELVAVASRDPPEEILD